MINGLPYIEAFTCGLLVAIVAVRIVVGRYVFLKCLFGDGAEDIKKEPSVKTTER